ncbi:HWE histidine kinase domain-containing protein [Methylobacterium sp. Leaf117]|uniref:HWE histidine kinase domain-containing protein n=1 Tax=Methylobacterium sp. Leaf117 TaxID=1736260 RepID=UPI0006F4A742|nr:HWE histidine kinase domain-containing protein [Methylobacterium sp. Leaf117]KQP96074.1 two-component system sensor histidine kinase/response regulator [Methylobacterium sp. Leaf117]
MTDHAERTQPLDLSSCDREPIHILGAVQPFGFLIAVSSDWIVVRASENAAVRLGLLEPDLLGLPLSDLIDGETIHLIRGHLQALRGPDAIDRIFGTPLRPGGTPYDIALHLSDGAIVMEMEPSVSEHLNAGNLVRSMVGRLQQTIGFNPFCREAARQMRALTGFDRVMVYRFDPDGSGVVIAESARSSLDPYLGLHYPASDIPKQARALYERNWLRIIADVDAEPVAVLPQRDPHGRPLDLSMSTLRTVSPIHLEYLRNMGVAASLSVSILRGGKLWGLFACHHTEPRHISLERRTGAELFGQMFSLILESREREAEAAYEGSSRALHDRLMGALASGGTSLENITDFLDDIAGIVTCDGIGVWVNGQITLRGATPTAEEFTGLVRFLNRTATSRAFATQEIGAVHPPAADYTERAAGLLAIPISRAPRDFLVFFRTELARTVTWAGNPEKPASLGPNGLRLTPRKSFEAWTEVVRGQSAPWSAADLRIAEALRITLLEVILRLTDSAEKERKTAQERQELLIAELNHRVRNILNLIRGIVAQSRSRATSVEEFSSVIGERIQALARAHDQITTTNWGPGSLRDLITLEAEAYLNQQAVRVRLEGTDVLLEPQAFSTLALVIHELMTNSAKYGALSEAAGQVDVAWERDPSDCLVIHWCESGGPPVKPPSRRGFGTTLIERSIPYELKGEAEISYALTGLRGRFAVPARYVRPAPIAQPQAAPGRESMPDLDPITLSGTVLVVEDNMIIALEAEEILASLGASAVDMAGSVHEALRQIEAARPSFALLDVNLGSETSLPVARRLLASGIPFVFATGYGESFRIPPELGAVMMIKKPYTADTLRRALASLPGRQ